MNLLFFTLAIVLASALLGYFFDIVEQSTFPDRFPTLMAALFAVVVIPASYLIWTYAPTL